MFWENGLREFEGIGWDKMKDYFESQLEEFKFNRGISVSVKAVNKCPERKRYLRTINPAALLWAVRRHLW